MNPGPLQQIKLLRPDLDRILAAGLELAAEEARERWPETFEWQSSYEDLLHLSRDSDAFYD